MTVFDLVFLIVLLCIVVTLTVAAYAAIRRRFARAFRVLAGLGIVLVTYVAVVIIVSLVSPARVLAVGQARCFDDWCMTVAKVDHSSAGPGRNAYTVDFVLSSRMLRRAQREEDLVVSLVDDQGNHYPAAPAPSAVPFDVMLQPSQSITTKRVFELPAQTRAAGIALSHSGLRPEFFIIGGDESLLHKKTLVRFN